MTAEASSRAPRSSSRWIGLARRWPGCATGISTGAPCCACGSNDPGGGMAKLTVSVAGVDYDRTRALFDGTVPIAGFETICCAMSPEEAFQSRLPLSGIRHHRIVAVQQHGAYRQGGERLCRDSGVPVAAVSPF